ncbi:MAG: CaiB/BaiF CoA-transferase family protein [Pseudomonadota bacterium]
MSEEYLFADLKVLDVGSWIAAPVATTMLADFGAQVIKVELPGLGDAYRNFSATAGAPDSATNYAWQMDARNKRSLSLNLKTQEGRDILQRLIQEADVYVTNHSPQMRENWSLTYADLQALNPRLIYAALTAYGETGPERDREGFDLVAYWSRSGLMDLVRAPGAAPAPALPGMGDHPTAVAMYAGILTALLRRHKTGAGSFVHTSLLANGMWSASCIAQAAFVESEFGRYRRMLGHLFTRVMYETEDHRWLQFTMVRAEDELAAMFAVLGLPELLVDERFAEPEKRLAAGDQLVALIRPVIATRPSAEWLAEFNAAGVPVALVAEVEELPTDQQVIANNMVRAPGDTGLDQLLKPPVNVEGLALVTPSRAPEIGEHTDEILQEMGYADAEIAALRNRGVL